MLEDNASKAHAEAISVLHALLSSIPNFWSTGDFLLIIELYLCQTVYSKQHQGQVSSFVKTLAKRAPSKLLLPTLCDLWTRLAAKDVCLTLSSSDWQPSDMIPVCFSLLRSKYLVTCSSYGEQSRVRIELCFRTTCAPYSGPSLTSSLSAPLSLTAGLRYANTDFHTACAYIRQRWRTTASRLSSSWLSS